MKGIRPNGRRPGRPLNELSDRYNRETRSGKSSGLISWPWAII